MPRSADNQPPIAPKARDISILRTLLECRSMTMRHSSRIHFEGRFEAAKKQFRKLKALGYIGERVRRVNEPSVLFLTRKGIALLHAEGVLADYPPFALPALERRARGAESTLRHELAVMDVKAAFHEQIRVTPRFRIKEFTTWPALNEFQVSLSTKGGKFLTVKPDGYIHVEARSDGQSEFDLEQRLFVEVDRSTEVLDTLALKAACYLEYLRSGGFAVRNGAQRSQFKDYPFRVLMILKNAERRNNIAARLVVGTPQILSFVCLTTHDEVVKDPLGSIWICPMDYRDAVKGSRFEGSPELNLPTYKHQTERDELVAERIRRRKILEE